MFITMAFHVIAAGSLLAFYAALISCVQLARRLATPSDASKPKSHLYSLWQRNMCVRERRRTCDVKDLLLPLATANASDTCSEMSTMRMKIPRSHPFLLAQLLGTISAPTNFLLPGEAICHGPTSTLGQTPKVTSSRSN